MTAKELIEALNSDGIMPGDLVWEDEKGEIPMWSSIGSHYATQEKSWTRLAKANGLTLKDLARVMSRGGPNPGIEGLYELTKDEVLFQETDYHGAADTDLYVVSYFYGGEERIRHWEANVGANPGTLMSSLGWLFNGNMEMLSSGDGFVIDPAHATSDFGSREEILTKLWRAGWDIRIESAKRAQQVEPATGPKGDLEVWRCYGKNLSIQGAVGRILDQ